MHGIASAERLEKIPRPVLAEEDSNVLKQRKGDPEYREILQRMRLKYTGNNLAQKALDMLDPTHPYAKRMAEYLETPDNTPKKRKLETWLAERGYTEPRLDIYTPQP